MNENYSFAYLINLPLVKPTTQFDSFCIQFINELVCEHEVTGIYTNVSPSIERITGYKREEIIGTNPYDFFHPDDSESIQKLGHLPSIEGEETTVEEYRFRKKNGEYIWLRTETHPIKNDESKVEKLVTVSTDISELVAAKQRIKRLEFLYKETNELAKIGSWEFDIEKGEFSWTKESSEIAEVEEDFIPSMEGLLKFFTDEARRRLNNVIEIAITQGKSYDTTLPFITGKGNQIWVRNIGKPEIKFGKTVRLHGILQDINRNIEKQNNKLRMLVSQLTQQNKQLEEFNQIVSHNLRSPLTNTSMLLYSLERAKTDEDRKEIIDKMKQSHSYINELLEELVDIVSKLNTKELEQDDIDIRAIIENTVKLLQQSIEENQATVTIGNMEWSEINYPKIYMESIILNLVSNAIKDRSEQRPPVIVIETYLDGEEKKLRFSDNGSGINLKQHGEKIFRLHKTFHKDKPGKGLGLFMTKNQIEAMGGEIVVESEVEKGTTFRITFNKIH